MASNIARRLAAVDLPFMTGEAFTPLFGSTPKPWTEREPGQCNWPVGESLSCCNQVLHHGWCEAHVRAGLVKSTRVVAPRRQCAA